MTHRTEVVVVMTKVDDIQWDTMINTEKDPWDDFEGEQKMELVNSPVKPPQPSIYECTEFEIRPLSICMGIVTANISSNPIPPPQSLTKPTFKWTFPTTSPLNNFVFQPGVPQPEPYPEPLAILEEQKHHDEIERDFSEYKLHQLSCPKCIRKNEMARKRHLQHLRDKRYRRRHGLPDPEYHPAVEPHVNRRDVLDNDTPIDLELLNSELYVCVLHARYI